MGTTGALVCGIGSEDVRILTVVFWLIEIRARRNGRYVMFSWESQRQAIRRGDKSSRKAGVRAVVCRGFTDCEMCGVVVALLISKFSMFLV